MRSIGVVLAVTLFAASLTGCANRATAKIDPSANLSAIKTVHVVKDPEDSRAVNDLIADDLRKRGYSVTTSTDKAAGVDALVTYVDRWMWDITMYMIELTVTIRDGKTEYPLAVGNSMHTSLTRKSPPEMVDEVMGNIFKEAQQ